MKIKFMKSTWGMDEYDLNVNLEKIKEAGFDGVEMRATENSEGSKVLYCCPEFGPYPYMPEFPFTREPLADLWEINLWMFEFLKNRYQTNAK